MMAKAQTAGRELQQSKSQKCVHDGKLSDSPAGHACRPT